MEPRRKGRRPGAQPHRGKLARVDRARLEQCVRGIEADIAREGYELVDVVLGRSEGRLLVELLIDHARGIANDDCARCHETAGNWFEAVDPIDGPYMLQVSSPGMDRPLRKLEHFGRFSGSLVRMRVHRPEGGSRGLRGRLAGVEGDAVLLTVEGEEDVTRIALCDIASARLEIDWDALGGEMDQRPGEPPRGPAMGDGS